MKKIAVIGVTESVGREILAFLADGGYRPSDTAALETKVPLGTQVSFGEEEDIDVGNLEDFDFAEAEIAILPHRRKFPAVMPPRRRPKAVK